MACMEELRKLDELTVDAVSETVIYGLKQIFQVASWLLCFLWLDVFRPNADRLRKAWPMVRGWS